MLRARDGEASVVNLLKGYSIVRATQYTTRKTCCFNQSSACAVKRWILHQLNTSRTPNGLDGT
jgi:hypothetical protein